MTTFEQTLENEMEQVSELVKTTSGLIRMYWLARADALRFALELYREEKQPS